MNEPSLSPSTEFERLRARQTELERQIAELQDRLNSSEADRRASEKRLRDITDNLPGLVGYVDRDQRYRFNNKAYQHWFGHPSDELYGLHIREAVGEKAYETVRTSVEAALAGERVSFEWWRTTEAETQSFVRSEYIPHVLEDGSIDGFYLLATDLTELKRSEESLRESEQRLRVAIEAGRMAIWELHIPTQNVRISRELNQLLGLELDAIPTAAELRARYHPDDLDRVQQAGRAALARGDHYTEVEFRFIRPDGEVRWLLVRAEIRPDEEGKPAYFVGVVIDITSQKEAEEALRASETLKSAILESALDSIVTVNSESRIVEWNPSAEQTFGYSRDEALGHDLAALIIPPEYREQHRRGMAHYVATGRESVLGQRIELEALRADGSRFPVELAINSIQIAGKAHFTAYLRDLNDSKRAEAALRENEQRLRATYEHAFIGIGEVDTDGRFLRVNEQLCSLSGYSRDELLARTITDLTHPDDRASDLEKFYRQMKGDLHTYSVEKRYIHKHGHIIWVEVAASRVDDAAGRPLYGIRAVRDITGHKRAGEHQRLLINELNHRVKNTLATVQSIASQTLRNASSPEQARSDLEGRFLALSRAHDVLTRESWEGASLDEIIAQAFRPYRSHGEKRFHCQGPAARLSPHMSLAVAMALQELVTNAVKYGALSNPTGEVHLTWSIEQAAKSPRLSLRWEERGGPLVCPPTRRGFGSRLIERSLAHELEGEVKIEFARTGVICTVEAPLRSEATEQEPA
ncbi:PAS domain-containing sensor histidine kinase [Microvirga sp. 2TAF3]|uniref:PAS domain-containing sensor histidine kinase n=1 Tax=Microvirga sp. 2TAF3 TaxID=3233014 RepID=UPI003F97637D